MTDSVASRCVFRNPKSKHDRVILVEGERFYCRTAHLSAWSKFFSSLLTTGFGERNQKEIELQLLSAEDFQLFMELTQTSKKIESMDECIRLLNIEQYLTSTGIQSLCIRYLLNQKDLEVIDLLDIANEFTIMELVNRCLMMIANNSSLKQFKKNNIDFFLTLHANVRALFGDESLDMP